MAVHMLLIFQKKHSYEFYLFEEFLLIIWESFWHYVVIKQNISTSVFLYISGTDKDDVEAAWVLVGGQGSLSCHVEPEENPQEQIATVLWYRGTQGEPIFT